MNKFNNDSCQNIICYQWPNFLWEPEINQYVIFIFSLLYFLLKNLVIIVFLSKLTFLLLSYLNSQQPTNSCSINFSVIILYTHSNCWNVYDNVRAFLSTLALFKTLKIIILQRLILFKISWAIKHWNYKFTSCKSSCELK